MSHLKLTVLGVCVWGALSIVTSCGGSAESTGTDSNTHWLEECDSDGDCGALSCICGVCSTPCAGGADCEAFGSDAACEIPSGCEAALGATACVRGSGGDGSGGSGGSPEPCTAMDARSGPANCGTLVGHAYNGKICEPIFCSCEGGDCDDVFSSADACDHAYNDCYIEQGISRSCTEHGDCGVQNRTCCPSCATPDVGSLIAVHVRSSAEGRRSAGLCLGDASIECGKCLPAVHPSVYAACIEGECRLLDVSEHAACVTDDDCQLRTKDCCACGGDFTWHGLVAVNATFSAADYCAADTLCAECEGGPIDEGISKRCNQELGKCERVMPE